MLESAKQCAEIIALRWYAAEKHRWRRQPGERRRPHLAGTVAELPFEGTAETGGIRETQIFGDRRDRLSGRVVGQYRMGFEQPLTLNVPGHAPVSSNSR